MDRGSGYCSASIESNDAGLTTQDYRYTVKSAEIIQSNEPMKLPRRRRLIKDK